MTAARSETAGSEEGHSAVSTVHILWVRGRPEKGHLHGRKACRGEINRSQISQVSLQYITENYGYVTTGNPKNFN